MKIKLIRPNFADIRSSDAMEPLSFAVLAALTSRDVELALTDERLEPIRYGEAADLVALTVETFTAKHAYEIAAEFRRRGVRVVMGGFHPTTLPEEAGQHADAIVIGDAEGLWLQLVQDAKAGRLAPRYQQNAMPELAGVLPDRRIFHGQRYLPLNLVQTGRGCRFACDFCSIHAFYGAAVRRRPVQEVVNEIKALPRRHIFFVDDNVFSDPVQAAELFRALIPLNIRWSCQVSIDICQHDELLALMAESGCQAVLIGFESLEPRNLTQMKKRWALTGGDYATAIRKIQNRGMMIYGTFVLGYDFDTAASFDATVDFAVRNKLFLANFNPLMPMPGTPLYQRLQEQGRLLYDRWWLDSRFRYGHAMFRPQNMSAEELTAGCLRARQAFNAYSSMIQRALHWKTNCRTPRRLGTFVLGNLVSRREIRAKQGLALGSGGTDPSGGGVL